MEETLRTVYRQYRGLLWRGQCLKFCKVTNTAFIGKAWSVAERALYTDSGMAVIHCSMRYPHQQQITKYCIAASLRLHWVWNNCVVVKLRYQSIHKVSAPVNLLWKQVTGSKLVSRTINYFRSVGF
jgi:hypothetical protein